VVGIVVIVQDITERKKSSGRGLAADRQSEIRLPSWDHAVPAREAAKKAA
jgi:hypothetical protein